MRKNEWEAQTRQILAHIEKQISDNDAKQKKVDERILALIERRTELIKLNHAAKLKRLYLSRKIKRNRKQFLVGLPKELAGGFTPDEVEG